MIAGSCFKFRYPTDRFITSSPPMGSLPGRTGRLSSIRFRTSGRTSWRAAGNAPNAESAKTASPTTSTPTRRARTGRWRSIPSRFSSPRRSGGYRGGHHSTGSSTQSGSRRHLRPAPARLERRPAGGLAFCQSGFSAAAGWIGVPRGFVPASARGRSGALARWPLVGAGGPHAIAFGNRLCARKSNHRLGRSAGRSSARRTSGVWLRFSAPSATALLGMARSDIREWCC